MRCSQATWEETYESYYESQKNDKHIKKVNKNKRNDSTCTKQTNRNKHTE
jgi:hypothetical protein